MERIKKWFENGCQYLEGIRLYESLPRANKLLITRFKKKHTTTNLEKLQKRNHTREKESFFS